VAKRQARKKKREHGGSAASDPREQFFKPGGAYSKGAKIPARFKKRKR
jgi:hypothetical protein